MTTKAKTKAEPSDEKNALIESLQDQIDALRMQVDEGKPQAMRNDIERRLELLDDPYDLQAPFRFIGEIPSDEDFPEGQVLRWLNPLIRQKRGSRGYMYMQWGDKYVGKDGELLKNYIPDPPERMSGPDKLDSYVRRADLILGRLDKRLWKTRRLKQSLETAQRRGMLETPELTKTEINGVMMTGKGMRPDTPSKETTGMPSLGSGQHRKEMFVNED